MARRRKADDAAGGFLIVLAVAIILAVFVVRFIVTIGFYALAPCLLIAWLATWRPPGLRINGEPLQYDDQAAWQNITSMLSKRRRILASIHDQYAIGFSHGLTLTAKSDERLFHAGSKLGKQINYRLEQNFGELSALGAEIRRLRLSVLQKIPDWRAPIDKYLFLRKAHKACGVSMAIFLFFSLSLYKSNIVSLEIMREVQSVLLWDPNPEFIKGNLVIAFGVASVTFAFVWLFGNDREWKTVPINAYAEWQSLEAKWSREIETEIADLQTEEAPNTNTNDCNNNSKDSADSSESWHSVLGVGRDASSDEIKRAYKEAIKQYHPDRVSGLGEKLRRVAEEESKRLNAAFSEAKRTKGFV